MVKGRPRDRVIETGEGRKLTLEDFAAGFEGAIREHLPQAAHTLRCLPLGSFPFTDSPWHLHLIVEGQSPIHLAPVPEYWDTPERATQYYRDFFKRHHWTPDGARLG